MDREDLLFSLAMGFLFGLFAFAAGMVRIHWWGRGRQPRSPSAPNHVDDRHGAGGTIGPRRGSLLAGLDQLLVVDRILDLLGILFILALLSYGAWVAPRVRYVLGSAAVTVVACWVVWRTISKWIPGSER